MIEFFADKKSLSQVPAVQDGNGRYWWSNTKRTYYRPKILEFSKPPKLPKGYKFLGGGSHAKYLHEKAWDFSLEAGTKIIASHSVKINAIKRIGKKRHYGIEIVWGNHHILLIHVETKYKVGQRVPAGAVICTVMSAAENKASGLYDKKTGRGYPPHLHIGTNNAGKFDKMTIKQMIAKREAEKKKKPIVDPKDKYIIELENKIRALEDLNKQSINDGASALADCMETVSQWKEKAINNEKAVKKVNKDVSDIKDTFKFKGSNELFKRYLIVVKEKVEQFDRIVNKVASIVKAISKVLSKLKFWQNVKRNRQTNKRN